MRVAFETLGCRLNQAETASLAGGFESLGFEIDNDPTTADVLVVHSCAVTRTAEQEGLRLLRRARRDGTHRLVVFTGCAAAVASPETLQAEGADLVVPQDRKQDLPRIVADALGLSPLSIHGALPRFGTTRALVKIQDGCDFRCAYCIVPDTRGAPRSRPFAEILREASGLAGTGFREIVLTGVNVACYADDGRTLADLLRALADVAAIRRIRLGSIEPATTERAVVDLCATEPKLCRTLHFPLQSGDARILKAMRRRYTPEEYADAVRYALSRVPRLGLGTDIITGFPGEDEAAFEATRELVERLPFSNLHVFPYSERPGTPAADLPDPVPVELRRARARALLDLAALKRRAYAASWVGQMVEVLVERRAPDGTAKGWTGEYVETRIAGAPADAAGQLVRVVADAVAGDCLLAHWRGGVPTS